MPTTRTGSDELQALALDDLRELGSRLSGVDIVVTGPEHISIHTAGTSWPATVIARDAISEADVRQLHVTATRGRKVVVANRISDAARGLLTGVGWSWFDRRVGAHLAGPEGSVEILFVEERGRREGEDRFRPPRLASEGPIRGRAGIAYAAALLLQPERPSFRSVAADIAMSPTAVSNAAKLLSEEGLLEPDGGPSTPALFDALAAVWGPLKVAPVAVVPSADDERLQTHCSDLRGPGWALGGDLAALELGAPVFATDERPVLWVPTQVELRRAERHLGPASWDGRAAVLLAAPTPRVCRDRRPAGPAGWPLVHPLFAALDLAQDRGRGREILKAWRPKGVRVAWR